MTSPNLGLLSKLPREVRDAVYHFVGSDLQKPITNDVLFNFQLLKALETMPLRATNKQLFSEFLETFASEHTFIGLQNLSRTLHCDLQPLLEFFSAHIGHKLHVQGLGLEVYEKCTTNPSTDNNVTIPRLIKRCLKQLRHYHETYSIPARKIFIHSKCLVPDFSMSFVTLSRIGYMGYVKDFYEFRTIGINTWMTDQQASVQQLNEATNSARTQIDELLVLLPIMKLPWIVQFLREDFDFSDGRNKLIDAISVQHTSIIDRAVQFWQAEDERYNVKDLFDLAEKWTISEMEE